jgi:hypothetical protein
MRFTSLVAFLLWASCGGNGAAGPEAPADTSSLDSAADALADVGPASPADADAAAAETAPPRFQWVLPVCYQACDRVVSCAVSSCNGYNWAVAGEVFETCFSACGDSTAEDLLAEESCEGVLAWAAGTLPGFQDGCGADPCAAACDKFAGCVVTECPAVEEPVRPQIAQMCMDSCVPETVAWVLAASDCGQLVKPIADADRAFKQGCYGSTGACATAEQCAEYAGKVAACIVEHCEGNADPYKAGLVAATADYCAKSENCPPVDAVEYVLWPAVTCDSEGLSTVGKDPPFTAMCEGTLGATPDQVKQACVNLMACPGAEWLASQDLCMVFLAFLDDPGTRIACLAQAAACNEVYGCLEGLQ